MSAGAQTASSKRKRATAQELSAAPISPRSTKRKRNTAAVASGSVNVVDLTDESVPASISPRKKSKSSSSYLEEITERRARRFRTHPPNSFVEKLMRATTQRMYVVGQTRSGTDAVPEGKFDIVGTTGNIYRVGIGKEPSCSCPDARKRSDLCKHIIYVLVNVLKAPEHLQYQLAFLSSELREIFQGAPSSSKDSASTEDTAGKRKPVEGDCPICFMEFDPNTEEIVWCKAACGNNVHKVCFQRWATTQRQSGVRCVYCRSDWQADEKGLELSSLLQHGRVNDEGYVNVADQLGMSGERGMRPSLYFPLFRFFSLIEN
ncbi:hypothetical protein Plec18167_006822 [Paecilomyces lecythidis]|uniref:Uncharacterized protein n=1 Tax=Paecilomyces lecythidis TaxID=3004212 RepID=A0ABR3X998_9EURO